MVGNDQSNVRELKWDDLEYSKWDQGLGLMHNPA